LDLLIQPEFHKDICTHKITYTCSDLKLSTVAAYDTQTYCWFWYSDELEVLQLDLHRLLDVVTRPGDIEQGIQVDHS